MNVVVHDRFITAEVLHLPWDLLEVDRYSHSMYGGPDMAYLNARITADKWDLVKLLRCPIEIYGDDGRLNWYGYINRITVPYGNIRVGLGLDNMFNSVAVSYSKLDAGKNKSTQQVTTAWAIDYPSFNEYGQKQKRLSIGNASAAQATAARDTFLDLHKYAPQEWELSGGEETIAIECYGWFKIFDWRYYDQSENANTKTTAQLEDIVGIFSDIIDPITIDVDSGIESNQFRDGRTTCDSLIIELLDAGTTNVRPLLATMYVDWQNMIHDGRPSFYCKERPAETVEYLIRSDGNAESMLGAFIPPQWCLCSFWASIKDVPSTLGSASSLRPFFVGSSEYNAVEDKVTYKPAGAFEPLRLAKWARVRQSNGDGSANTTLPPADEIPPWAEDLATGFRTYTWIIPVPAVDTYPGPVIKSDSTITSIASFIVGGTSADFNVEIRTAPDGGGTNSMSSEEQAVPGSVSEITSFASSSITEDQVLFLDISEVQGEIEYLVVTVGVQA